MFWKHTLLIANNTVRLMLDREDNSGLEAHPMSEEDRSDKDTGKVKEMMKLNAFLITPYL